MSTRLLLLPFLRRTRVLAVQCSTSYPAVPVHYQYGSSADGSAPLSAAGVVVNIGGGDVSYLPLAVFALYGCRCSFCTRSDTSYLAMPVSCQCKYWCRASLALVSQGAHVRPNGRMGPVKLRHRHFLIGFGRKVVPPVPTLARKPFFKGPSGAKLWKTRPPDLSRPREILRSALAGGLQELTPKSSPAPAAEARSSP